MCSVLTYITPGGEGVSVTNATGEDGADSQ